MTGTSNLRVTRIAHSTALITLDNVSILTDPWFSEKFGYHPGEKRGIDVKHLPRLSAIVVSHKHYDHYDMKSLASYPDKNVPVVVIPNIGDQAKNAGFKNVIELETWKTVTIDDFKITAVPAKHGVPENAYVIELRGYTVYFAGDSLLIPEMSQIAEKWKSIDVAILPVNGLMIRPSGNKKVVMNDEDAVELCKIIRPRIAIPTHYAFTGGKFMDSLILKYTGSAEGFVEKARALEPTTQAVLLEPGKEYVVPISP